MKTLLYVTWLEFRNKLKKALKRPVTYLFLVGALAYIVLVGGVLLQWVRRIHFNNPWGLAVVITVLLFFSLPTSYLMYARRKGIYFKPYYAHFIFNAPISPKKILIYGAWKNILGDLVFAAVIFGVGVGCFQVSLWKMLLIASTWIVMTCLQEAGIIILLYGNEKIKVEKMSIAGKILIGILGIAIAFGTFYVWKNGLSLSSVKSLLDAPGLQMIPLIGWNVAVYRLILLGPTTVNVIGTVLYVLSTLLLAFAAWKMPCEGGYYEEAAKFADEYQALRKRNQKGEKGNGKAKYRKIRGGIRGEGAKAIFARQFLEYKKAKYFVFSSMSLISFFLAFVMSRVSGGNGKYAGLSLLGVLAYVIFCTSGYIGKWEKELETPYIYLIPEKPLVKMWYATLMEHVKSFFDGAVMCCFIGFSWKIPVWQIISCILIYVLFQACRMYMRILALYILGDHFGLQIRKILQLFIQSSLMGVGIAVALVVGVMININFVFPILLVYSMIVTVGVMILAASRFEVLEQME